ncbi:MAG TPA: hypothetical protein DHV60_10240, partial [Verrucomicrobiales bacterium]|nr:hypothetical protein [Verrucomicrobiales bacterium]
MTLARVTKGPVKRPVLVSTQSKIRYGMQQTKPIPRHLPKEQPMNSPQHPDTLESAFYGLEKTEYRHFTVIPRTPVIGGVIEGVWRPCTSTRRLC